jgi:FdhD protein
MTPNTGNDAGATDRRIACPDDHSNTILQRAVNDRPLKTEIRQVLRWKSDGNTRRISDELAAEEPLEIRVDTRPVSVTMRTPGHDDELAAGFLLTEGLIRRREDITAIKAHPRSESGNVLDVFLASDLTVDFEQLTRHVFASSSCGLCGKATIKAVHQRFKPLRGRLPVKASTVLSLPEKMRRRQEAFERTGGLHAAAVFDRRGRMVVLREDVGRHNAVDKVIGYGLLHRLLPFRRHILLVSGRVSFEIVQKGLAAHIAVVCAVSAPSNLAVEFARRSRQTLIGFLRGETMNVYSHPRRIHAD